ncbi:unnamed protein product [Dovyalis caffra]|uniref:Chlororespiratory reduction 4 n=1 Tax=Dovyalis caffra TaxID=77055 RepID=A0AAV1RRS9_9ROSI|nr:unnamed protein product [Dovyalis caffra]
MLLLACTSLVSSSSSVLDSLLSHSSDLKHIHQTHAFMLLRALDTDNFLLSRFIHACSSLGFSSYAYSVFASITHSPDIYLYNSIINALSCSPPHLKSSIFLYNNIQLAGLRPDTYSFPFALKAVTRSSSVHTGRQLHSQSIRFGHHSHLHVLTALVRMYSSFGSPSISDARKLFDETSMTTGDVALWNAMLNGYAKLGDLHNARGLFERMPQRNVISWTALVTGYDQANRPHDAIALFRRMQLEKVEPDEIAILVALSACARLGALELGEWIHNYIDKHGLLNTTIPLNNALIDMYAKSGDITRALQVFENMKRKTIITWTTMIAGLALHGLGREALEMFSRMERERVKPNDITFIAVLSACGHVGLVQTGKWYFQCMVSRYKIEPKIEHYGCLIDLLGRAGHLKEAQKLLAQMPFEPSAAIWGSLLAACNTYGDAELGELALHHLLELEPDNSGNYALLSNIYASHGRWNESRMVRKVMRDAGVKKMPGGSLIEVNNRVHEFIAGETSHPQFDRIHEILSKINRQLGLAWHLEEESSALLE